MVRIKANIRKLTPTLVLKRLHLHSESIANLPIFEEDAIKTELIEASIELEDALTQQDLVAKKVQEIAARVQQARERGIDAITKLANKVSIDAQTNPNLVYETGFELLDSTPSYQTKIDPPMHLTLTESNGTAKLEASVKSMVKVAKSYIFQINYDISNDKGWQQILISTRSKNTLLGLESGKRVWVRVAAVGTAGQSDWSDVASRIVP